MILSLSAKDLESLFYDVLKNFYTQSLAVRHILLKTPILNPKKSPQI